MRIVDPLDRAQKPPIETVLEGRHFVPVGFWGVGNIGVVYIIV